MAIAEATPSVFTAAPPDEPGRAWVRRLAIIIPAVLVGLVTLACFVAPLVLPIPKPTGGNIMESSLPAFSPGHLLGTDPNGNDILARVLYGGRNSLFVAIAVTVAGMVVGGTFGALSAYFGGTVDMLIMRVFDVFIAFPALVLILAVAQSLGPSKLNTIMALSFFSIPATARISRPATLSLCEQPFIAAAKLCGTSWRRTLLRHIAPNIAPQLLTFSILGMGLIIVIEGALSFLGLGIAPPAPSWGNMIAEGQASLSATPMLVIWPSLMLFVTVLAFNLLSDALRSRWSSR
jgi:peptide/nickel transport system permease protein